MADITDVEAIAFSNRLVRTGADILASLYYECNHLIDVKNADADTADTIETRTGHIRSVADMMLSMIQLVPIRENIWANVGVGEVISSKIPNSIDDDMIDRQRMSITGADVHNVMSRIIDIDKWLADQGFGGDGSGVNRTAMLNTIVVCGSNGNNPLIVAEVDLFFNRCIEIITEYEASSNAKLTHLLAVSPNPRNPA